MVGISVNAVGNPIYYALDYHGIAKGFSPMWNRSCKRLLSHVESLIGHGHSGHFMNGPDRIPPKEYQRHAYQIQKF